MLLAIFAACKEFGRPVGINDTRDFQKHQLLASLTSRAGCRGWWGSAVNGTPGIGPGPGLPPPATASLKFWKREPIRTTAAAVRT
jgi:hypothetical protein